MSVTNGTAYKLKVGADSGSLKLIADETSSDQTLVRAMRDVTSKLSNGWKEQEYGLKESSFSVSALDNPDQSSSTYYRRIDFINAMLNGTKLAFEYSDAVTGHPKFTGTLLVANVGTSAPMEDNATYTVDLQVSGAVAVGTVS